MEMGCGEVSADRDCIFNKPKVQIVFYILTFRGKESTKQCVPE